MSHYHCNIDNIFYSHSTLTCDCKAETGKSSVIVSYGLSIGNTAQTQFSTCVCRRLFQQYCLNSLSNVLKNSELHILQRQQFEFKLLSVLRNVLTLVKAANITQICSLVFPNGGESNSTVFRISLFCKKNSNIFTTTQLSLCVFDIMMSNSDLVVTSSSNTCNKAKLMSSTGRIFPCSSISFRRNVREFDMISHINSQILLCFSGSSSTPNRSIMRVLASTRIDMKTNPAKTNKILTKGVDTLVLCFDGIDLSISD
ncbi:hypothetical protein Bhyg_13598 [Pseudolycoriella hygida]|uniref:Uncharacterized protein n=1 Tax=Pseudolycoriella hygida TaxID=35572 RepID=A0A9Q0MNK0_9DIPT|nr:hypothetical protein Bhyg_13598 [Pseudolycoriella hygida]